MEKIAEFKKVSLKQFIDDYIDLFGVYHDQAITEIYNNIKLPERKTRFSAGHDFFMPLEIIINPGESAIIPTGVRCSMATEWVLSLYPRSSLGMRHIHLANTIGIIDSDYYYADNEGHIMAKLVNDGDEPLLLHQGDSFMQGIFTMYGIADNGVNVDRTGGFGSTGR